MEGSVWLDQDDNAVQFIGLFKMLLMNGKMVDSFFVINPVTIGGGNKDLRDAKDVPTNMTALVVTLRSYISLIEYSCIYS